MANKFLKNTTDADFGNYFKKDSAPKKNSQQVIIQDAKPWLNKRVKYLLILFVILGIAQALYWFMNYQQTNKPAPAGFEYSSSSKEPPRLVPVAQ